MTTLDERPHRTAHRIDLSAVAHDSTTESLRREHDDPEQPSSHPIDEQLQGLVTPTDLWYP